MPQKYVEFKVENYFTDSNFKCIFTYLYIFIILFRYSVIMFSVMIIFALQFSKQQRHIQRRLLNFCRFYFLSSCLFSG